MGGQSAAGGSARCADQRRQSRPSAPKRPLPPAALAVRPMPPTPIWGGGPDDRRSRNPECARTATYAPPPSSIDRLEAGFGDGEEGWTLGRRGLDRRRHQPLLVEVRGRRRLRRRDRGARSRPSTAAPSRPSGTCRPGVRQDFRDGRRRHDASGARAPGPGPLLVGGRRRRLPVDARAT